MALELIGYRLCPYVQRALITLLCKQADHTTTFFKPTEPPAWFAEASPLGTVPLLRLDENTVLFESNVITAFIDETTPGTLFPEDPVQRAFSRAWVEYSSACIKELPKIATGNQATHEAAREALLAKLAKVAAKKASGPFFRGETFSLVDIAFAPLFCRLNVLNKFNPAVTLESLPTVEEWSRAILDKEEVKKSFTPALAKMYQGFVKSKGSYMSGFIT